MDLSPEKAEEIVRYAAKTSAAVGPRVLRVLLAQLDKERADHKRLLAAYWQQEYALYLAGSGGETGSNPPPPIAPPADAGRMLAPVPGELCTDEHEPMIDEQGYCSACSLLRALRTG